LCWPRPQGREACGLAGHTVEQVRVRDQPQHCQGIRPQLPAGVAGHRRRGDRVKRRDFITLLGGAAALPLAVARAAAESTPRIGLLWPGDAPPASPRMESVRQGLRAVGFGDGQNAAIELRYAQRGPQQLPELAAELVRLKVDVILAPGDLAPKVAQQATETIPIVAGGDDILGAGIVASLSRPGGNTTGNTILS